MQYDFVYGSLKVPGGQSVVHAINECIADWPGPIVYTQDWHCSKHPSFKEQGGLWPPHCVGLTPGAALVVTQSDRTAGLFKKGHWEECYSGMKAFGNGNFTLEETLKKWGTKRVVIVGLAFDYCVKATALDARAAGLDVIILMGKTAGVAEDSSMQAAHELLNAGVTLLAI